MSDKPSIYDKNGQFTKDGHDVESVLSDELRKVIERYSAGYNRIEFEHLIKNCLHFQLAFHFIMTNEWPQQGNKTYENTK